MPTYPEKKKSGLFTDPFAYIGFWQMLTFVILILVVWLNEYRDMAALFFGSHSETPNVSRGCLLTAAVLITAITVVGNTYLQQKRILEHLLAICSNCHKIRINDNWQRIETYLSEQTQLNFTHGLCPDCKKEIMQTIENRIKRPDKPPSGIRPV